MYQPEPLDTGAVELSPQLEELMENLARNTHEVWAAQRLRDGWQFGHERNDEKKLHPCLIPYEELSEEEKEYDRNTSRQALMAILAFGFKIES